MKACKKCGIVKPLSEYYKREDSRDGYHQQCQDCIREKSIKWNHSHKKQRRINDRKYWKKKYSKNPQFYIRLKNLHIWMRKHKKKQKYCTVCNEEKFLQIASIGHTYTKNPKEWMWLCLECHIIFDRRTRLSRTKGEKTE